MTKELTPEEKEAAVMELLAKYGLELTWLSDTCYVLHGPQEGAERLQRELPSVYAFIMSKATGAPVVFKGGFQ